MVALELSYMSQSKTATTVRRRALDRLWIVVADGGQARVLGVTGDRRGLVMLREMSSVDAHRRTQELVSDRPGRSFESGATARHAIAPRQDAHAVARQRFIGQVAQMLMEDNRARQFDELVLIIAPGLSATLRDALDEATRARVRETLVKDLTKVPLRDIYDRLVDAGLLPAPPAVRSPYDQGR
jgi:protein required for attachment to host cells